MVASLIVLLHFRNLPTHNWTFSPYLGLYFFPYAFETSSESKFRHLTQSSKSWGTCFFLFINNREDPNVFTVKQTIVAQWLQLTSNGYEIVIFG